MGDEYPNDWKGRLFDKLDAASKEHQALKTEVALLRQKQGWMWAIFVFFGVSIGGLIVERLMNVL